MTARGAVYKAACKVVDRRSHGECEAPLEWRITYGCWGRATEHHHMRRRRSEADDAPEWLLHTCDPCHRAIHAYVELAYEYGLLVRSGRPSKLTRTITQATSQDLRGEP